MLRLWFVKRSWCSIISVYPQWTSPDVIKEKWIRCPWLITHTPGFPHTLSDDTRDYVRSAKYPVKCEKASSSLWTAVHACWPLDVGHMWDKCQTGEGANHSINFLLREETYGLALTQLTIRWGCFSQRSRVTWFPPQTGGHIFKL